MKKQYFYFLSVLLFTFAVNQTGFAAMSGLKITGAFSNIIFDDNGMNHVYGGIGPGIPCYIGVTGTCNTCTDEFYPTANQNNMACNTKAIGPDSLFTIKFTSSAVGVAIGLMNGTTIVPTQNHVKYKANKQMTLTYRWADICSQLGDSTCMSVISNDITLVLSVLDNAMKVVDGQMVMFHVAQIENTASATSGGLQDFNTLPGDQKTYLKNLTAFNGNFTIGTGANITDVVVFSTLSGCETGNEADEMLNSMAPTFLSVDEKGVLGSDQITNEKNGQEYLFKVAVRDQANNIGLFTASPASANPNSCAPLYQTSTPKP